MHTTEQLLKISSREFNLPKGKDVTHDFKEASEKITWQNKRKRKTFPTLEVLNAVTRESASVEANAAELILADTLPITDIGPSHDRGGALNGRLLMGRLSVLQLHLAEQVGLNPVDAAILAPLHNGGDVRQLRALGSYWDDNYFSYGEDSTPEAVVTLMQGQLNKRYNFRDSIYRTAKEKDTYEVVSIESRRSAKAKLRRILAQQGYKLIENRMPIGMQEDEPAISAIAPAERGLPGPIYIAGNDSYRLAANDALRILEETPEIVFGPQEYLDLSTGKMVTY